MNTFILSEFLKTSFLLLVPLEKREKKTKKDAEEEEKEEDKDYEPGSSEDEEEDEESGEEERSASESEDRDDSESSSSDAEELPSTSKPLKEIIRDEVKEVKKPSKRKAVPDRETTPSSTPVKKVKTSVKSKTKTSTSTKSEKKKKAVRNTDRKEKTGKPDKKENADEKMKDVSDKPTEKEAEDVKKRVVEYNDKNVDYNLYTEAPEHIKPVKCKLNSNTMMVCRMIEASSYSTPSNLSSDYAAVSFVKLNKNNKAFEFNLPLSLAPNIIKGLSMMIKDNPRFFEKQINSFNFENLVK